jgi:hypothetical protein
MSSSESKSNATHVSQSDLSEEAQRLEGPGSKGRGLTSAAETQDVVPLSQSDTKAEEKAFELSPSHARARFNLTGDGSQATVKIYHRNDDGTEPLPAESLFSSSEGRKRLLVKLHINSCVLRLDWDDGELVGVRVNGAFPSKPGTPPARRRRVFTVQQSARGTDLGIERKLVAAKAVFSDSGAPELLEVDAGGRAGKSESSNDRTAVSIDWRDGALMGVRVQGQIEGPVESERTQVRRTFKVRHRKNDILLALDTSDGPPALDYVRALDKVRVETVNAVREEILNAASGVVAAAWGGRTPSERVNAALPLVLIAQVQRSGGTLLSQLFDGHPEVWAFPHELKWGGDPKYRWPNVDPRTEGPLRIARSLVAGNFIDSRGFNLFGYQKEGTSNRDQRLPFNWSQWAYVETFLDAWEAKPPETRRQCLDIFLSAYFSAFLDWRRNGAAKKVVTAFTPRVNFIKSFPKNTAFFDDYPDGTMISICRHPGDWYASASRHEVMYEEPDQAMQYWRESVEGSLQLKKRYPEQVMLVSAAALVADPSRAMRQISERLGLTWSPTLVVPTFNGMPIASNSSFNSVVGIDTSTVGRRDLLPAEVRKRIEADNLALYQRFMETADVT